METNWQQVIEEIKTYRRYYNALPQSANDYKKKAYFISKEELFRLLKQKGDDDFLDGIRIYFGGVMVEGQLVPTLHITACERDVATDKMNDYKVGDQAPSGTNMPLAGRAQPCPVYCGKSNILNR